jgi:hypothetical protein
VADRVIDFIEDENGCWIWQRAISKNGYAQQVRDGRQQGVHRLFYEDFIGPIPDGLQLDHLCRVRACVNPGHLEPVTCGENLRRSPLTLAGQNAVKTHCAKGHPFDEANTYITAKGNRQCRRCQRETMRAKRIAERAAA